MNKEDIIQLNGLLRGNKLRGITSDIEDDSRAFIFFENGVLHVKDIYFSKYMDEVQATVNQVNIIKKRLKDNTEKRLSL